MTDDRPRPPHRNPPPGGGGPRPPLTSARRRWLTLLVVILLVGVPAGYIMISAQQSRESGRDKQSKAAATGLTHRWPARVQRRIYEVPIPPHSTKVAHYETNNWRTSKLYVQFRTTPAGLKRFLHHVGAGGSSLEEGRIPISREEAATVGWRFGRGAAAPSPSGTPSPSASGTPSPSGSASPAGPSPAPSTRWAGTVHAPPKPQPKQEIVVDRSEPSRPTVYVVSTVNP